jgi:hypothetical protein
LKLTLFAVLPRGVAKVGSSPVSSGSARSVWVGLLTQCSSSELWAGFAERCGFERLKMSAVLEITRVWASRGLRDRVFSAARPPKVPRVGREAHHERVRGIAERRAWSMKRAGPLECFLGIGGSCESAQVPSVSEAYLSDLARRFERPPRPKARRRGTAAPHVALVLRLRRTFDAVAHGARD